MRWANTPLTVCAVCPNYLKYPFQAVCLFTILGSRYDFFPLRWEMDARGISSIFIAHAVGGDAIRWWWWWWWCAADCVHVIPHFLPKGTKMSLARTPRGL